MLKWVLDTVGRLENAMKKRSIRISANTTYWLFRDIYRASRVEQFNNMNKKVASCFFGLILITNLSNSQVLIESLKDGTLPSNLEIIGPGASAVIFSSNGLAFNGAGMIGNSEGRAYVRTKKTDMLSNSFVAEITMSFVPGQQSSAWYGIGADSINTSFYNEPAGAAMQIAPHTATGGEFDGRIAYGDVDANRVGDGGRFFYVNSTVYKMRITWNSINSTALFEVDSNYAGSEFVSDASISFFGGDNGFNASNSRLFFGGSDGVTFKDLNVVPEPSALSLIAVGLGGLALIRRRRS